ncbi:MAG: hemolysin D [Bacteroidota bacterium]|nr:MAG: secretion protein HylD [Bacteroidetes bacterium OLB12]GIL22678.1 MAG: hemolysin D [Bacteroidota bacterium]HNR73925.1 efflux RND transporter periplasmic adaptor subunit [Cyclobacteriaceae bacterium]HNU42892.1 efflux RND transporter periplasmic adaptor subunit [Cyclobacteriaceae bacterium]
MKKVLIYIILAVVLAATAYVFFFRKSSSAIAVKTTKATTGSITKMVTATGTVEPLNQVEVGTQVSGVIKKIYADYNSEVKAGQLLAELDKTNLLATVNEAEASLKTALNEQNYRQKNFDRINQLHQNKVVSDTDYEEALYILNNAIGTTEQRKSDLTRAKTNLSYASITSPINGVVISRAVEEGQTVAASYSTPTLFTIAQDLKQMQVEANVDEADIGQVKVEQRVMFTVDAYPEDSFNGSVTQVRLEPIEESNVITYTVIIKADNPEGKLMPGLTASISIYTFEQNNVLTLESHALTFNPDPQQLQQYLKQQGLNEAVDFSQTPPSTDTSKTVWVKEGASIKPQTVTIGSTDGIITEVKTGLRDGQEIVYGFETITQTSSSGSSSESPFMPKPPGSNRNNNSKK